jgi:hypothetical protein
VRSFFVLAAAALVALTGCGSQRTNGPKGDPAAVVAGAVDKTLSAGVAQLSVNGPDGLLADGTVDLAHRSGRLFVRVPGQPPVEVAPGPPPPTLPPPARKIEFTDPPGLLALLRGATRVVPYGGVQVRSVGTIRYDVVIDLDLAASRAATPAERTSLEQARADLGRATFYANVFVDTEGRLRRIEIPADRKEPRPTDRASFLPRVITVDFVSFRA